MRRLFNKQDTTQTYLLIILVALSLTSCAAKRDGFLSAQDISSAIKLPKDAVKPISSYYVPPSTNEEKNIVFVNRPRPKPEFIGQTPKGYESNKIKNNEFVLQTIELGYNSDGQPALRISPFSRQTDEAEFILTLNAVGLSEEADSGVFSTKDSIDYDSQKKIKVTFYSSLVMLHIIHDKDKQNIDKDADFNLLESIRRELLAL